MQNSNKITIRKEILSQLYSHSDEEKKQKSLLIEDKLFSLELFKKAHVVMFYVSRNEEVDTHRMIRKVLKIGKKVVVPYSESKTNQIIASELKDPDKDLEVGPYGIFQPSTRKLKEIPVGEIDLVIVPGVAFDENNNRLGRGKGYYDKFLKKMQSRTVTIGLCFDFQLIRNLPTEAHDLPVSCVVTN